MAQLPTHPIQTSLELMDLIIQYLTAKVETPQHMSQ